MMNEKNGFQGGVGLAEAIEALRAELTEAMSAGSEEGLRFRPGPVEVTVEAALTKGFGGKAGIKWWLLEAGGEASRESVVTQTLKLTLQPVLVNPHGDIVDILIEGADDSRPDTLDEEEAPTVGAE